MSEQRAGKDIREYAPYILMVAGSIIGFAANFTKYLTSSGFFFSRKVSIFQLIIETIDDPARALATTGDKVAFGIIIAGAGFSAVAVLSAIFRKPKSAITFSVLAFLPFLMIGKAWFHYAGFGLTIVSAIWYLIEVY